MDKLGVEIQVIYPTLFLVYLTDDPKLETALCRAYNRFIADACAKAAERLKWVAILPLRDIEASLVEMKWAKEQGAVGVFLSRHGRQSDSGQPVFLADLRAWPKSSI